MKNNYLMTIALAVLFFSASAQDERSSMDKRDQLQFGLKAGVNFSNVYDSKGEEFRADGKFGLTAGLFVSIPIGVYLGIQPEILFSQKGFKATGTILGGKYEYTNTTNYLDLPLYLTLKPSGFITLLIGPQVSFLLSERNVFATGVTSILQEQEFQNDNIRKNSVSFSAGADINLNHFVIGVRAAWDFIDNKGDGSSTTPRYKNQWLSLTFGYRF